MINYLYNYIMKMLSAHKYFLSLGCTEILNFSNDFIHGNLPHLTHIYGNSDTGISTFINLLTNLTDKKFCYVTKQTLKNIVNNNYDYIIINKRESDQFEKFEVDQINNCYTLKISSKFIYISNQTYNEHAILTFHMNIKNNIDWKMDKDTKLAFIKYINLF